MEGGSENEDITAQFLQHHQGSEQSYILGGGGSVSVDEDDDDSRDGDDERSTGMLREQDRFLPIANVARLMKRSIPKTGKIAKDARECVQECVSEFVSFITSEASDRCHQEKRKTINGEDILVAMSTLGFDNYVEPLKLYLQKYREANKGDKPLALGESSNVIINTVQGVNPTGGVTLTTVGNNTTAQQNTVVFTYTDTTPRTQAAGQPGFSM